MIVSKIFRFEAAHYLPDHPKCGQLHGHSYKIEVAVSGPILPPGFTMDFHDLKAAVQKTVIDRLDHTHLNAILEYPSAENLAMWIWQQIPLKLAYVRVWETEGAMVEYDGHP